MHMANLRLIAKLIVLYQIEFPKDENVLYVYYMSYIYIYICSGLECHLK